jgi:hypothetical protein
MWLRAEHPELAQIDEGIRARGQIIEAISGYARQLLPEGVTITGRSSEDRVWATAEAIRAGAEVIHGAAFECEGLATQVPTIYRRGSGWVGRDVRAAKRINEGHLTDAKFMVHVMAESGLNVEGFEVILVAADAPSPLLARVEELFTVEDLTDLCLSARREVAQQAEDLRAQMADGRAAAIGPGRHCDSDCTFYGHCFGVLADDDLLFAPSLDKRKYEQFKSEGINRMSEVSPSVALSPKAEYVRQALSTGEDLYIPIGFDGLMAGVRYPAVFLDFEAAAPILPVNPGMRGGELAVFQFSAHVLSEPGGEVTHYEFLDFESDNPHAAMVLALQPVIRGAGSIFHYASFEKRCLERLGDEELLREFLGKAIDLEAMFRDQVYHRGFRGRTSLKVVASVLVPGFDYADLAVQSGGVAESSYVLAKLGLLTGPALDDRRQELRAYCARDTLAMVRIFERLERASRGIMS